MIMEYFWVYVSGFSVIMETPPPVWGGEGVG
jgi:hypothetical protein